MPRTGHQRHGNSLHKRGHRNISKRASPGLLFQARIRAARPQRAFRVCTADVHSADSHLVAASRLFVAPAPMALASFAHWRRLFAKRKKKHTGAVDDPVLPGIASHAIAQGRRNTRTDSSHHQTCVGCAGHTTNDTQRHPWAPRVSRHKAYPAAFAGTSFLLTQYSLCLTDVLPSCRHF